MLSNEPYDVDLAYVHDTGFGDLARHAASCLLRILEGDETSKLVVDLGCGSGITARMLVDAGYRVLGVDVSAAMIELARRRVPEAEFHIDSFASFPIPACRAVMAPGEVFNYLFDTNNSLATLRQVFQKVYDALVPNGVFVFDICEPERCRGLTQAFRETEDWACLVDFQRDEAGRQLTRRIITFRRIGATYRRHEETHRQQLYEKTDVADMLRSTGFVVEIITGYGERPFPEGVAAFIARKM